MLRFIRLLPCLQFCLVVMATTLVLSAVGIQNNPLNRGATCTLFKHIAKPVLLYAMELQQVQFQSQARFKGRVVFELERNGDLAAQCFLDIVLPGIKFNAGSGCDAPDDDPEVARAYWVSCIGYRITDKKEMQLGGSSVDQAYPVIMEIRRQLYYKAQNDAGNLVGCWENIEQAVWESYRGLHLHVPEQWTFCEFVALALPLLALEYHKCRFELFVAPLSDLVINEYLVDYTDPEDECVDDFSNWLMTGDTPVKVSDNCPVNNDDLNIQYLVNYIYVSRVERRAIVSTTHNQLVTQTSNPVLYNFGKNAGRVSIELRLNHVVQALYWAVTTKENQCNNNWFDWSCNGESPFCSYQIRLNMVDKFKTLSHKVAQEVIPFMAAVRTPRGFASMHWFSIDPECDQPRGGANFTRINTQQLFLDMNADCEGTVVIHSRYKNVICFVNGLAGNAFSN